MLQRLRQRLVFKIRLIICSKLFQCANWLWTSKSIPIGAKTLDVTFSLLHTKSRNTSLETLNTAYVEAAHRARYGYMKESIKQRITILDEIYNNNGIKSSDQNYFAPMLHPSWGQWFGHQSNVLALSFAQQFGVVTVGTRYLPVTELSDFSMVSESEERWTLKKIVLESGSNWLKVLPSSSLNEFANFTPANHLFENSDVIRTTHGFLDIHSFLKIIFSKLNQAGPSNFLPDSYTFFARQRLDKLVPGLSRYEKYAVLHLRESGDSDDAKKVSPENYLETIRMITRKGIAVVRIGTGSDNQSMKKLPQIPGLFDLATFDLKLHQDLHPYLLTTSTFVITTHSGVHVLPALAGVPVLSTNCIGPGFQLLERSTGSLSLPKRFELNGKPMPIHQLLSSRVGYAEMTLTEFKNLGVILHENTSEEILVATTQLLYELTNRVHAKNRLANLMAELESISNGRIPDSYFELNPWFLSC
jgi:putative glycosyltransferase (TIGR04372 family)